MIVSEQYDYTDPSALPLIRNLFLGRSIAKAEWDVPEPDGNTLDDESGSWGRLTLDDGTELYLVGHDGDDAGHFGLVAVWGANEISDVRVVQGFHHQAGMPSLRLEVFASDEWTVAALFVGTEDWDTVAFHILVARPDTDDDGGPE